MKRTMRTRDLAFALALLGSAPLTAVADTGYQAIHPMMSTRFQIEAGAMFANSDPRLELDASDGEDGTDISGGMLGIDDDSTAPFGSLRWRITDRWRLESQYFGLDNSGSRYLEDPIKWGDLEFDLGALVKSRFKSDIARAFGGYSFLKNNQWELGAGAGLHYLSFEAKLSGQATIDGELAGYHKDKADVSGVVPNIGLYGDYAFNQRWLVQGRLDWFSASIDKYDGRLWRVGASVIYHPFEHFNFGLGYEYLDLDLKIDASDWNGKIDSDYYGPSAFIGLTF